MLDKQHLLKDYEEELKDTDLYVKNELSRVLKKFEQLKEELEDAQLAINSILLRKSREQKELTLEVLLVGSALEYLENLMLKRRELQDDYTQGYVDGIETAVNTLKETRREVFK